MSEKTKTRKTMITNATLRSLKAGDSSWFVRDAVQTGFQIKVSPSGKAVYQVEARLGGTGRVKKYKLGNVQDMELPEARKRAATALNKIRQGIDPLQEKRANLHKGITLKELTELYYQARDLKQRTLRDYKYLATNRFTNWLETRVSDITKHEILDWYMQEKKKRPTQAEHAYRFLNALMVFAKGMEIIKENPCHLVTDTKVRYSIKTKQSHIEVNRDIARFLSAFIGYKFVRDSEKVARDLILLILTTGLRSLEARSMEWKNVNFERRIFTIPDTKNKRPHAVPMTPLTYSLFRYREEHSDGSKYVFRIRGNSKSGYMTDIQKTLTNICNAAGIDVVTPHDLRRTFATVLNSLGVGYADVKHLMNHKAKDITAGVYIQPDIENMRRILWKVVDFYDRKIPYFPQGMMMGENMVASQFTSGVLRFSIYGRGEVLPEELDNPTEENPDWQAFNERMIWED